MADEIDDQFLAACGGSGPLRITVHAPGETGPESREFPGPFVLIGRTPGADIVLDHPDVGRRHAYLQRIGGRLFCTDLGSRSGIRREHGPDGSGWLDSGETIRIGPHAIRAEFDDGDADPWAKDGLPNPLEVTDERAGGLPGVTLEFPRGGPEVVAWRMNRVLALVGREPGCRIRLAGPGVSAFHCSLLRTPGALWAVDLKGRYGLRINKRNVSFARLGDGDEVRVGRHRIRVRIDVVPADGAWALPALHRGPGLPMSGPPRGAIGPVPPDVAQIPGLAGLADSLMGHMAGQLGQFQQQMFDQFQQTMMMMAQMFGALHRDQAEAVRAELERLRQLNQELAALQGELTARRDPAPSAPRGVLPVAPPPPREAARPGSTSPPKPADAPRVSPPRRGEAVAPTSGDAIHLQLSRRIAEMQVEQQGRWRRLLDLMMSRREMP